MKTILRIAALGGILLVAAPAIAQLHVGIGINVGPPPPRKEVILAQPYPDAVWIPGYYRWNVRRHHYVWVRGRWARPPRPNVAWVEGHWERRNNEWVYFEGRWEGRHGGHEGEHREDHRGERPGHHR